MSTDLGPRLAILAALVATVGLVGCADAVDRIDETRETITGGDDADGAGAATTEAYGMTAMQAHEVAAERAEAWDEDAELTHVSAVEMEDTERMAVVMANATPEAADLEPDPRLADGRSPQWAFQFATPDRDRAVELLVTSDGEARVLDGNAQPDDVHAITEDAWQVDSDEALEAVREHPKVGPLLEEDPDRTIHWTLAFPEQPGHLWQIWIQDATEGPRGERATAPVFVNATTGELEDPFRPPQEPERFEHEGSLPAEEDAFTLPLDTRTDQAARVHVNAQLTWDAEARLNLTLLDGDGSPVDASDRSGGSSSVTAEYRGLDPGDYELRVTLEEAGADEVAFSLQGDVIFVDG